VHLPSRHQAGRRGVIGLIIPAVTAVLLCLSGASASAAQTALCKANEEVCSEANVVKHLHLTAKNPTLLANFFVPVTVVCEESLALLHVEGPTAAAPLLLDVLQLLWQGCETTTGQECSVTNTSLGTLLVLRGVGSRQLGTVQSHGTNVNVNCGSLINCTYGGLPTLEFEGAGHTKTAGNGMIKANNLAVEQQGGLLCPSTANWHALYEPLEAVYGSTGVAGGPTALCKANEEVCSEANVVKHLHLTAKNPTLLANFFVPVTVVCEESLALLHVEGPTAAAPLLLDVLQLLWQGCETTTGQECSVTNTSLGTLLVLRGVGSRQLGTVQSHGTNVNVNCGSLINCTYGGLPTLEFEGAGHTKTAGNGMIKANNLAVEQQGGLLCPSTANWHALYEPLEAVYGSA
jgi:hypothetical protein